MVFFTYAYTVRLEHPTEARGREMIIVKGKTVDATSTELDGDLSANVVSWVSTQSKYGIESTNEEE